MKVEKIGEETIIRLEDKNEIIHLKNLIAAGSIYLTYKKIDFTKSCRFEEKLLRELNK